MFNPLLEAIKSKPFLGICLGLKFSSIQVKKVKKGLGVINGSITKIKDIQSENLKIPHMGWNNVKIEKHQLFAGIEIVVFICSFFVATKTEASIPLHTMEKVCLVLA